MLGITRYFLVEEAVGNFKFYFTHPELSTKKAKTRRVKNMLQRHGLGKEWKNNADVLNIVKFLCFYDIVEHLHNQPKSCVKSVSRR